MLKRAISARYAGALFALAKETGKLETVERDFARAVGTLDGNADVDAFMAHPAIGVAEKLQVAESLFSGKVDAAVYDFVCLLVEKKREQYLRMILEDFGALLMEHRGKQKATVFTPYELSPETKSSIIAGLEKSAGKKIDLEQVVDKTLIGGIKVQIGDMVYDGSVRSGLERMREALGAARL